MAKPRPSLLGVARRALDVLVAFLRLAWEFVGVDGLAELLLLLLFGGW